MEPESQTPITFDTLRDAAERILTGYHEHTVVIASATLLTEPDRRNRIWRCHLKASEGLIPQSVIIKQVSPEGYDPSTVDSWDTSRFFKDWAGARFLSEVVSEERNGPVFYGGDIEQGCVVLEDLGEHASLVQPLLEGDALTASEALIAFARRLGRMHAFSIGKEERYREIQRDISPAWAADVVKTSEDMQEARANQCAEFIKTCALLEIEPGKEAEQEFVSFLERLEESGPFRTFIHSDPCPDNVFYHAPELKLIDFEFSCFGHALKDGLYGRLPFPTCWCANAVPSAMIQRMENTYRAELAGVCPEALDDQRFSQEASAVAAFWTFDVLRGGLEQALKQEETWGIAGTRERILSRILMFLDTARSANQMPALCDVYAKLLADLQRQWPETTLLPVYPAFRAG